MARTNTLQVFRSAHATYDNDTDPTGLNYGELGWNNGGEKLFIGKQTTTGTPGTVVKFQINPAASATVAGLVELATDAEAITGTDATIAVTPDNLGAWTGNTSITSVGDIDVGTWSGDNIGAAYLPDASTTAEGIVELATNTETNTGTDTTRALTPSNLTQWANDTTTPISANKLPDATATAVGAIELATEAEVEAGTDTTRAVTPITLKKWAEDTTVAIAAGKLPTLNAITLPAADVSLNSHKIVSLATCTADTDAANKGYVDSLAQGLDVKASVKLATAGSLPNNTYTQGQTTDGIGAYLEGASNGFLHPVSSTNKIDSVAVAVNDRVLVKNETAAKNGIYTLTTLGGSSAKWKLTRATDFDEDDEITSAAFTFVEQGTDNANSGFVVSTAGAIEFSSNLFSGVAWSQFSGAGQITPGDALNATGNRLDVNIKANAGVIITSDELELDLGASTINGSLADGNIDSASTWNNKQNALSFGAVANGGSDIPTGDHVYDFVIGLGYSTTTGDVTLTGSQTLTNKTIDCGTF